MATVQANGIDIHARWDGPEGAPVMLLSNSLGTRLEMWDDQMEALTAHFRVLRYDSRGHGRSSAPDRDYTIDELGTDAVALLDALEIDKVYYCGLSKGGMVGQWLGCHAGDRVHKLVLSNTAAFMGPRDLWDDRVRISREQGMEPMVEPILERWFTKAFRESSPDRVATVRAQLLATPGHGYGACSAAIRDMDQRETIKSITTPTLVIAGAADPATPPEAGQLIADSIPGAGIEIIPDAAHLANIEQTGIYNRVLVDFLTS
ncbi:MAG: 3-oxoadipate enol-lactonase [Pseudomonadota bacterium]